MGVEPVVDYRAGASVRSRLVFGAARLVAKPLLTHWPLNPVGFRVLPLIDEVVRFVPRPRYASFEQVRFDGFTAEWARANEIADRPLADGVVLYFHGGAFVCCGTGTHRRAVARISAACGLPVLSVAYRQLPAVTLAGSVADCVSVYQWVLDQGVAPERVVFAGDSAGGHLAFAAALAASKAGLPVPAGIVAISPWLDFDTTEKLAHRNVKRDAYLPARRLAALRALLTEGALPLDPLLSPVNDDLAALPPTMLVVSESEMLLPDSELMAERLGAAGVPCTLQIWEGQVHVFTALGNLLPEGVAAIGDIGGFVREAVSRPIARRRRRRGRALRAIAS